MSLAVKSYAKLAQTLSKSKIALATARDWWWTQLNCRSNQGAVMDLYHSITLLCYSKEWIAMLLMSISYPTSSIKTYQIQARQPMMKFWVAISFCHEIHSICWCPLAFLSASWCSCFHFGCRSRAKIKVTFTYQDLQSRLPMKKSSVKRWGDVQQRLKKSRSASMKTPPASDISP